MVVVAHLWGHTTKVNLPPGSRPGGFLISCRRPVGAAVAAGRPAGEPGQAGLLGGTTLWQLPPRRRVFVDMKRCVKPPSIPVLGACTLPHAYWSRPGAPLPSASSITRSAKFCSSARQPFWPPGPSTASRCGRAFSCKRGKTGGGGMNIRFTGGRESDSFWACRRPRISTSCRQPS